MNLTPQSPPVDAPEERARAWWQATLSAADGDRSARASLRRASSPLEAVTIPAALALARRLGRIPSRDALPWKQRGFERALGLAVVLAGVRTDSSTPLLRALGWGQFPYDASEADSKAGRPALSELRFKRFLQIEGEEELIAGFSRLIALAGGVTDVAALARMYLRWDDDRTKRDVALTYFGAQTLGLAAAD